MIILVFSCCSICIQVVDERNVNLVYICFRLYRVWRQSLKWNNMPQFYFSVFMVSGVNWFASYPVLFSLLMNEQWSFHITCVHGQMMLSLHFQCCLIIVLGSFTNSFFQDLMWRDLQPTPSVWFEEIYYNLQFVYWCFVTVCMYFLIIWWWYCCH